MGTERLSQWQIEEGDCTSLKFLDVDGDFCEVVTHSPKENLRIFLECNCVWIDRETARKLASVLSQFVETGELREPIE